MATETQSPIEVLRQAVAEMESVGQGGECFVHWPYSLIADAREALAQVEAVVAALKGLRRDALLVIEPDMHDADAALAPFVAKEGS